MKQLEVFKEDEIQHWARYTRLLNENRAKINELVDHANKRDRRHKIAKEAAEILRKKHEQER